MFLRVGHGIPIPLNNTEMKIFILLLILLIYVYIRVVKRGLKYDDYKLKLDKKYDGYHFVKFRFRGIQLPSFIKDDSKITDLQKLIKTYNNNMKLFYLISFIMIALCFNACLRN